jgi:hypothetical protein
MIRARWWSYSEENLLRRERKLSKGEGDDTDCNFLVGGVECSGVAIEHDLYKNIGNINVCTNFEMFNVKVLISFFGTQGWTLHGMKLAKLVHSAFFHLWRRGTNTIFTTFPPANMLLELKVRLRFLQCY